MDIYNAYKDKKPFYILENKKDEEKILTYMATQLDT